VGAAKTVDVIRDFVQAAEFVGSYGKRPFARTTLQTGWTSPAER
jgi:hypothetical protein